MKKVLEIFGADPAWGNVTLDEEKKPEKSEEVAGRENEKAETRLPPTKKEEN